MSIEIRNLTKTYGEQKAVNQISFCLNEGEITGFIGPNGSGKSTTMKSICGLLTADEGTIEINGQDVKEYSLEMKNKVGYLPENNPLYYDQYVKEYLYYVGKMYKISRLNKRIEEIVRLTGLSPEQNKKIGQLSKGYKQRVGLAQALIHDPEILILDEPTTGLDPNQLIEIRELIKNISSSKTVLLSTHILQEVEAICHKVIMINKGKIVADGKTENVYQSGSLNQTVFVELKEVVEKDLLMKIPGVDNVKKLGDKLWQLESSIKGDFREKVFEFVIKNNIFILELQSKRRSLEDRFRELSS